MSNTNKILFSTGIPTELVGSLPRTTALQKAFSDYEVGKIKYEELINQQNIAVKESIQKLEETKSPIISDGEQRWSSFATYPLAATLGGKKLAKNLVPGGQHFAFFADGHHRQLPLLAGQSFSYASFASESTKKALLLTTKSIKQAVISPSMLSLLYPLDKKISGYSREKFEIDLVNECQKDIREAFLAGAIRVSIDFTEGRLALRNDSRNPWTQRNKLSHFVSLINRVLECFSKEERKNIGIHTCPGGDRDSVHSADVPYSSLFSELFLINAGYFLIQCASERDKEKVYQDIANNLRTDAKGVKQIAFIGVINPLNPRVETPEEICEQLLKAAKYIPKDQLGSTDDCGFSPFSIDEKPNYGSPDFARESAFKKIANRVKGTILAAKKLGIL